MKCGGCHLQCVVIGSGITDSATGAPKLCVHGRPDADQAGAGAAGVSAAACLGLARLSAAAQQAHLPAHAALPASLDPGCAPFS